MRTLQNCSNSLIKFKYFFLFLILFLPFTTAGIFSSQDITFSVEQKEYYFKVGEDAIISLEIDNSYKKQISGVLSYTYSLDVDEGGMQMSSSKTQSIPFLVKDGKNTETISFGTFSKPSTLSVSLGFKYTEKEPRIVNLDEIQIHFVLDESEKKNKQNQQTSSSKKDSSQQSQNSDPFSQMQKKINDMVGKNQQQTTQQKMQNNQIEQDSSALKKQMQKQAQEQEQMKKKFQENLAKNSEFKKKQQELTNQGYNLTSGILDPTSENSGKFDLQYNNEKGEIADLKGEMDNGEIKNIESLTQEDKNKIMQELKQNKEFKKLDKKLNEKGFEQKNTKFFLEQNKTDVNIEYKNFENQTTTISADVINGTIQNIKVENLDEQDNYKDYFGLWLSILLLVLLIAGYFTYKKYYKKKLKIKEVIVQKNIEKTFDYKREARKLLDKAKVLFDEKKYKDAYEKAGQALRLYLSYKHGLKKEVTNDEILSFLSNKGKNYQQIRDFFDLCSLVEFAKYNANKNEFYQLLGFGKKIINKK